MGIFVQVEARVKRDVRLGDLHRFLSRMFASVRPLAKRSLARDLEMVYRCGLSILIYRKVIIALKSCPVPFPIMLPLSPPPLEFLLDPTFSYLHPEFPAGEIWLDLPPLPNPTPT